MQNNPGSNRMYSLLVLFDMQTTFFKSALDGISDKDAHNRLDTKANHIAWLCGSLVEQRWELAAGMNVSADLLKKRSAAPELFANHKGIQDGVTYPSLKAFQEDWDYITPILRAALHSATDAQLDRPFEMPELEMTYFDMVTFSSYREANCIGQIALWRRLLGYEAMKYM